ncbi:hypothetical protein Salat_2523400 [Sesamum alatum]|uniref:Uncharacterized protein n=1 Tax=Sesamum alatum TaxID=300844 RepID=A0AAE1XRX6_9LAMI|nr:hypothetical protein Salat_2523400 [Sesamum alatum]
MYVGGSVRKYDYVLPKECSIENLNVICYSLGLVGDRRFYVIVNRGFKLLLDNKEFRSEWRKIKKYREMSIYVEVVQGAEVDVLGEGVRNASVGDFTFLGQEGEFDDNDEGDEVVDNEFDEM